MSISVPLKELTDKEVNLIEKSLEIKTIPNIQYGESSTIIYPYSRDGDNVILPFSFTVNNLKRYPLQRGRTENLKFNGTLKDYQIEVKSRAIRSLNDKGSVMICMGCGMGKCLGKDVLVMKADGKLVLSQDIKIGDQLMGDDSKIRTVLSTCKGREKLYKINDKNSFYSYTVNSSHIITIVYAYHDKIKIEDIPLKLYLGFPESLKEKLWGCRVVINKFYNKVNIYPDSYYFFLGKKLASMIKDCEYTTALYDKSLYDCKYGDLSSRQSFILGFFSVYAGDENCFEFPQYILDIIYDISFIFRSLGYQCYISLSDTIDFVFVFSKESLSKNLLHYYPIEIEEIGEGEYYGFEIDGNGRFVLGDFTITHNTALSIYISTKINLKTMILTNLEILQEQWKDSISEFCSGARIQIVGAKDKIDNNANYYIMNPLNVPKRKRLEYSNIGLVIADEAHLLLTPCFIKAFQYFFPRYLIGLTATPERADGTDILFDIYFGTEKIFRDVKRDYLVYRISTGFIPSYDTDDNGKIVWNTVLISQADNEKRNDIILKIIDTYRTREFLVLCKRVSQAEYLYDKLKKEKVCRLYGKYKEIRDDDRIILATIKKAGVGFNRPSLNALILAGDTQQLYIQNLMRVMRSAESQPIIFDLVDDFKPLINHYYERKKVYSSTGGIIKNINLKKDSSFLK